jgi:sulfatase maturation enzyme AslB (radical SAM superfamily)
LICLFSTSVYPQSQIEEFIMTTSNFHVLTKPIGPICNLDCKYCFYLEKETLYPQVAKWAMQDDVLESYIRQYIESHDTPVINFAWQGGEPTLLGVDYFRKVVELQKALRERDADRKRVPDKRRIAEC